MLSSVRSTFRAKAPGPGQAGGAGTRREELTRLRGFPAPAGRVRFSAAFTRACSSRQPEVKGAGQRKRAHPSGLTGQGQSLRPPSAAARPGARGPGSRHSTGRATAADASALPAAQPPRRRRAFPTIMLRSAAAVAAAAPGPPSGAASFPPPGASRASAGDGRGGRGGGTQAAASSSPPSPPSSPAPPAGSARRARGSRGAMLAAASTTENASARAGAKPGKAAGAPRAGWRPGPPRALAHSLAHSLTHRVSSARRRRWACGAAEDAWGQSWHPPPPRGGSHGAGAAAGPARGLLRVHCVRLSVSPRGAGPGERGAWAEPRTGGSSGRRGTCAARAASPPRGRESPPHPLLPSLDLSSAPI